MDSALRPRDIQARIRAGETPEAVAEAAQTTVDKIMTYAGPVLAEREHVAERRAALVRAPRSGRVRRWGPHARRRRRSPPPRRQRRPRDGGLGRLAPRGRPLVARRPLRDAPSAEAPPSSPTTPRATTSSSTTTRRAGWSARSSPAPRRRLDDLEQARLRRRSAVPGDELPLGDDAIELVSRDETAQPRAPRRRSRRTSTTRPPPTTPRCVRRPRRRPASGRRARPTSRPPAGRCRRSAAGPRCRAGTRSCSAAATSSPPVSRAAQAGLPASTLRTCRTS